MSEPTDTAEPMEVDEKKPTVSSSAPTPAASSSSSSSSSSPTTTTKKNGRKRNSPKSPKNQHTPARASSAASAASSSADKKSSKRQKIQALILKFMKQLTLGCGRKNCSNELCASHPNAKKYSRAEAMKKAMELVRSGKTEDDLCQAGKHPVMGPPTPEVGPAASSSNSTPTPKSPPPLQMGVPASVTPLELHTVHELLKDAESKKSFSALIRRIGADFSDGEVLKYSFTLKDPQGNPLAPTAESPGLDFAALDEAYELLYEHDNLGNVLNGAIRRLMMTSNPMLMSTKPQGLLELRKYLLLLENPQWEDPELHPTFRDLIKRMVTAHEDAKDIIISWLARLPAQRLENLVKKVHMYITVRWYDPPLRAQDFMYPVRLLGMIYQASENPLPPVVRASKSAVDKGTADVQSVSDDMDIDDLHISSEEKKEEKTDAPGMVMSVAGGLRKAKLPYELFYNDAVNDGQLDLGADYERWMSSSALAFAFCQYPFMLDPGTKAKILRIDAQRQMAREHRQAFRSMFSGGPLVPYLVIEVRRHNIVEDALNQLAAGKGHYKKPMKVKFHNEAGIDEGGVRKEFFQLIIAELFDPSKGHDLFVYNKDTNLFWFNKNCIAGMMSQFELIGTLTGLAIYNSIILDFRFPPVIWKKLLTDNYSPTLEDLHHIDPELAKGLRDLLAFDGDVENTYCRTFSLTYDFFGQDKEVELKQGGKDIPLTADNRREYVRLYVRWVVTDSIERFFSEFKKGFKKVCGATILKLFRPEEVELLVCGSPEFDFHELQEATRYDDGFTKESRVIKWFWEVIHEFELEDKRKFLFFTTGSDRVPIKGLGDLGLVISRGGPDSERLPTSHTCFNHLLLPDYSSKDKLRTKLKVAIKNSKGFGLL